MKSRSIVMVLLALAFGCSGERSAQLAAPESSMVPEPAPLNVREVASSAPAVDRSRELADPDCVEQGAKETLQRAHLNRAAKSKEERTEMLRIRDEAIAYRTKEYGYFEGFGRRRDNPKTPGQQSRTTTFFGLPVILHERVIPALRCVEQQLMRDCAGEGYKPSNLSGLRRKNTYVDGEVSNHVYGIAIDIDPLRNPCCKCLEPWSSSERCKGKDKTVWERMAMPKCWVDTFERFGFYWLGHDVLEDTMHFEFLGDPEQVRREREPVAQGWTN